MPEDEIPAKYSDLRFWERGLAVARTWYHEEWDGSYIQLNLARDIAQAIEDEVSIAYSTAALGDHV